MKQPLSTYFIRGGLIYTIAALMSILIVITSFAAPSVRIKDLADFEGMRDNMLIGYSLVVGLNGTGDKTNSIPFTRQTMVNMLERLGVNSKDAIAQLKTKNVAAVMVTANMKSLVRQGSKIDVTVSSMGDAKSLEGGTLLATPLVGADGQTYAVAQGSIIIGGFTAEGKKTTITKNHPTVGRIASGAIIEKETGFELSDLGNSLRLVLRSPDFTTADRMRTAINNAFKQNIAKARDLGTLDITLSTENSDQLVSTIQKIENIRLTPAFAAKIVIDEKTGTIVMGENVQISNIAISHANLIIKIEEKLKAKMPEFTFNYAGEAVKLPSTKINIVTNDDPTHGKFDILKSNTNLADLVKGLNTLGIRPRDIISILQSVKAAGAIQAELVVL